MALRNRIKAILVGFGFSEAINYSFISADSGDRIGLADGDPLRRHVVLLNPISEEQAVMRTSLVPGMLEAVQRNISRRQRTLRLFEIGKVFLPHGDGILPLEKEVLVGLWTGAGVTAAWHARERACDFYDIKGVVEGLAAVLGIDGVRFTALADGSCPYMRSGYGAHVMAGETPLGVVGEVAAGVIENYTLRQPAFMFELELAALSALLPDGKRMTPIPRFPATDRDVTLIVDQHVESGRMVEYVKHAGHQLIETVYLFDVFEGDPIPAGKKSISFRLVYRSAEKTLEDEAVNVIHHQLTSQLIGEFDAALPA